MLLRVLNGLVALLNAFVVLALLKIHSGNVVHNRHIVAINLQSLVVALQSLINHKMEGNRKYFFELLLLVQSISLFFQALDLLLLLSQLGFSRLLFFLLLLLLLLRHEILLSWNFILLLSIELIGSSKSESNHLLQDLQFSGSAQSGIQQNTLEKRLSCKALMNPFSGSV